MVLPVRDLIRAWLTDKRDSARIALLYLFDRRWSRIAPLMNSRVSQLTSAITIAGTLLLWSNSFHNTAKGIKEMLNRAGIEIAPGLFDTSTRLQLIYYGGAVVLVSWLIYRARCPEVIRRQPILENYLLEQAQIQDRISYRQAQKLANTFPLDEGRWSSSTPSNVQRMT